MVRGWDPAEGQGPSQAMPENRAQGTPASCPLQEEALCPTSTTLPTAQTSRNRVGLAVWPWAEGAPSCLRNHSSYKFLNFPGAARQREQLVLHTGQRGARAGCRGLGCQSHHQALHSRATAPCKAGGAGGVGPLDIQALKYTRWWRPRQPAEGEDCRRWWVWRGPPPAHHGYRAKCLFHAAAQHLVGRDEHDANDEGDGEGANQTLAHARLADLLVGAGCGRPPGSTGERQKGTAERWNQEPPALLHMGSSHGAHRDTQPPSAKPWFLPCSSSWPSRGLPGVGHSLSTSTGHSSAVPRWLSSSVMIMFSMSFMDRCSQKVS